MVICMGAGDITKWAGGAAPTASARRGRANERASRPCRSVRGKLTADAPLAPLVWFKSGGTAEWLFEPADEEDLVAVPHELDPHVPVMALGLGSNLIVRDGGVPGVVVRLGKPFAKIEQLDETTLRCGGGASGILVSSTARDHGIAGLEFLRGIPGTVGGFVRMNGGAYGREVKDILVSARLVLRVGRRRRMAARQARLHLPPQRSAGGAVVVEATFRGDAGRSRGDRRGDGRHRPRPRGIAAAAQPHRRIDLQEPAGPQGLGADRRGRLPRPDHGRRPSLGKALQFPAQSR